jgi:hypothetical protein
MIYLGYKIGMTVFGELLLELLGVQQGVVLGMAFRMAACTRYWAGAWLQQT